MDRLWRTVRLDRDCARGDEWPNLSELSTVTDQDKIPRFANGEPIYPFGKPKHKWRTLGAIAFVWIVAILSVSAIIYLIVSLMGVRLAHAEERTFEEPRDPSVIIFDKAGECTIDIDLRVSGKKRAACVDRLETAARLAKGELKVNEPARSRRR